MGADQEIRKNAARTLIALLATPFRIGLERSTGRPPNWFIQVPINYDSVFFQQRTHKSFGAFGSGDEFGKYRGSDDQTPSTEGRFQSRLCGQTQSGVICPQRDDHVGINGCGHSKVAPEVAAASFPAHLS